jgi:polyisoprenoid-binding protein YceI
MKTKAFHNWLVSLMIINLVCLNQLVLAQNWLPISAEINFQINHFGTKAKGSFKGFNAVIVFDQTNLNTASIKASIDVKTIKTNINLRDYALKGKDYFDINKYPRISMISTKIAKNFGTNEFIGYFNVTIKNITKNIAIPFTFIENNKIGIFQGSFLVNRIEFGIGEKSLILGNNVEINILVKTQQ